MRVMKNVHQIRVDFQVTDEVRRFVYIYLITGKFCYLIDSGVSGSEKMIGEYMHNIGRKMEEIKAIFLTHAHPDHIGSAASIKEQTNCEIYCSKDARNWIEDVDLQFRERPIPNFYRLAERSVSVDRIVQDEDVICPEEGIEIKVLETAGHSKGDVSYLLNQCVLFSGDAIPAAEDFPIIVDIEKSIQTLDKIKACVFEQCCPAWDRVYEEKEREELLQNRKKLLINLNKTVSLADKHYIDLSDAEKIRIIAERMGWNCGAENPLFAASVVACRKRPYR